MNPPTTSINLNGRSFLREADFSKEELLYLVDLAEVLRTEKRTQNERKRMVGRNIALIFEKASTRTRCAFEVGAYDQGAAVTCLGPEGSHIGYKETMKDTARVIGRMFDGIQYRGFAQDTIEELAQFAGVPVWNGLTDQWHPTQSLADLLTMRDHLSKPLEQASLCYLGDGSNNVANSLLVTGALVGMDIRIVGPEPLLPSPQVQSLAERLGGPSGARISIGSDPGAGVRGADFLYTDVWVSMGEPASGWDERIDQMLPFQVNADLMKATGNPQVKFMHCLPAFHSADTEIGRQLHQKWGLDALEVTDEVFESSASVVFDQAENRLHTIKATMVATIGD
jgi:ornithine carbamoyltransferase